jgi:hypothetical protein
MKKSNPIVQRVINNILIQIRENLTKAEREY